MKRLLILAGLLLLGACANPYRAEIDATQAVVNERVAAGQMTPAEGRLAMAKVRRQMVDAIRAAGDSDGAVYQPVGGGTVIRY